MRCAPSYHFTRTSKSWTTSSNLSTTAQDVAEKIYRKRRTIEKIGEEESGKSVLEARHGDDD